MKQILKIEQTPVKTKLPIASQDTLGGIKVGANLTIDEDGTLNATASGGEGTNTIAIDNLPVGAVVAYDGEEIPYGYEEVEDYMPIYSLEEKVVGTYDTETIYRKIVRGNLDQSYANSYYKYLEIDNVKRLVNYGGSVFDTTDDSGNSFNLSEGCRVVLITTGSLRLDAIDTTYNSKYFDMWIEYTKRDSEGDSE